MRLVTKKTHLSRGEAFINQGIWAGAIQEYSKVIKLNPNYTAAYFWRGIAYQEKGNRARADVDFARVLEMKK